ILAILKSTADVLGTAAWPADDICPVCDLPQQSSLKTRVEEKIELYSNAKELDAALCAEALACPALDLLGQFESANALGVPHEERLATRISQAAKKGSVATPDIAKAGERLEALVAERDKRVEELEAGIKVLEDTLPPSVVA